MTYLPCYFNHLNAELNPICHLLALLGAHQIFHVSGLRVKLVLLLLPALPLTHPLVILRVSQSYFI